MEIPGSQLSAPTFTRTTSADDTARHESICSRCSRRVTAYTEQDLEQKQLKHKCRPAAIRAPKPQNSPKVKLY